jgi:site-specific recombinase XerD
VTEVISLTELHTDSGISAQTNPYRVYVASLAPGSRKAMSGCLDRIAALYLKECGADPATVDALTEPGDQFPWWRLEYQHTLKIAELLKEQGWAPSYVNKHVAALRMVLKHSWKLGLMTAEAQLRASDVERDKGTRLPAGRSLAAAEVTALLRVCVDDATTAGRRDAALVAVLYSTGLRRHEIAKAARQDYNPGERSLRVVGKRDKEREVYLTETAARYLGAWLALSAARTGPLFGALHKSGAVRAAGAMTPGAIGQIIGRRREQAGLPPLSAHDFRRTFIGDLLDAGADLATAKELAGHADASTTAGYDRRPGRTRRAAVDRLSLPMVTAT